MKLIQTDNFGRDYPNEKQVLNLDTGSWDVLERIADILNEHNGPNSQRYFRVVENDYELQPGFES